MRVKSNIEAVVDSWQEKGSIPVDLRGVTLGGALAILYESSSWAKAQSIPFVEVKFGEKFSWLRSKLNSTFIETEKESPLEYPLALNSFSRFAAHSSMRYLAQRGDYLSDLSTDIWDSFTKATVDKFLIGNSSKSQVLLSFRFQQGLPSRGDFSSELWRPIFNRLSANHKLTILGTEVPRGELAGQPVSFAEDTLDLPQQIELVSRPHFPLVGEANGFFSARIWSAIPYLCFKEKEYDQEEMLEEHDGKDRLRIGNSKQSFIRDSPSLKVIEKYLQEVKVESG